MPEPISNSGVLTPGMVKEFIRRHQYEDEQEHRRMLAKLGVYAPVIERMIKGDVCQN